jgi:hypothetical protein
MDREAFRPGWAKYFAKIVWDNFAGDSDKVV